MRLFISEWLFPPGFIFKVALKKLFRMERLLHLLEACRGLLHPMAIQSFYVALQLVSVVVMLVASLNVEIGTNRLFLIRYLSCLWRSINTNFQ